MRPLANGCFGAQRMDKAKLENYRRAVDELEDAVTQLRVGSSGWGVALDNYLKAKKRCDEAKAELHDSEIIDENIQ
jgi:hypothetical protein